MHPFVLVNFELVAIGFIIGGFVGISGVGGGSVMTPLLILVLRINPLVAVGTDLLYSVPTKILGAVVHSRQRTIDWAVVRALLAGGIPGVILGISLLFVLRYYFDFAHLTKLVREAVGFALFVSAISLICSVVFKRVQTLPVHDADKPTPAIAKRLYFGGAIVGLFVALTSVGSGAMTLPFLLLIAPYVGIRRLIGSDIAFAALLIPLAAAGHWSLGDLNPPIALNLLIGSLPGVYVGSKLCKNLSEVWLRPAVAAVLVIAGSRLL
ncbi:MAG: sulfite exporter TauE/SafE family protein [Candidatus Eremiobacteraeota bacterium]|nr:sulfite exporter TauE/SafE family protein [Candidatus Eremiobacteraeota bacterium]